MSFKLENFVAAPSMELLNLAKKTDLLNIADHYALNSVKPSMLNHEIKNILIKLHVSSDHENYYSWNKNSIIFSKIAQSVRGQTLHYCITHVTYEKITD